MQVRICKLFGPAIGESQGFKVKFRYSEKSTKTWPIFHITSVSKKPGQSIVLYHYCGLSRFF